MRRGARVWWTTASCSSATPPVWPTPPAARASGRRWSPACWRRTPYAPPADVTFAPTSIPIAWRSSGGWDAARRRRGFRCRRAWWPPPGARSSGRAGSRAAWSSTAGSSTRAPEDGGGSVVAGKAGKADGQPVVDQTQLAQQPRHGAPDLAGARRIRDLDALDPPRQLDLDLGVQPFIQDRAGQALVAFARAGGGLPDLALEALREGGVGHFVAEDLDLDHRSLRPWRGLPGGSKKPAARAGASANPRRAPRPRRPAPPRRSRPRRGRRRSSSR